MEGRVEVSILRCVQRLAPDREASRVAERAGQHRAIYRRPSVLGVTMRENIVRS